MTSPKTNVFNHPSGINFDHTKSPVSASGKTVQMRQEDILLVNDSKTVSKPNVNQVNPIAAPAQEANFSPQVDE